MSLEINSVILGGNLTKDVVLKETTTGRKVCSMVLANNFTYVSNREKRTETAFIDIDVWGIIGENCAKYLKKGSPVAIVGRLKQEQWQNDKGEKRSRLKIVASNVQFLPSARKEATGDAVINPAEASGEAVWDE